MNSGWRCPGCGKCYSPLTPQCFSCGQPTTTGTATGLFGGAGVGGGITVPAGGAKVTMPNMDIGHGCRYPMNCERKDGYCAKCHSEYY